MLVSPFSMADAPPGADYRVVGFRFGMVGDYCWTLGVRPGSEVRLRARTRQGVDLELSDGRRVRLDPLYARFVELLPRQAASAPSTGRRRPDDTGCGRREQAGSDR